MNKPPICLDLDSFVILYALIDESVKFMDRKNLNVGGEWLGKVPKLAISKNLNDDNYRLIHCDEDWTNLCGVETRKSLQEIKDIAEKHYNGINSKWLETSFMENDARKIIQDEIDKSLCSFCNENPYESDEELSMFVGKTAQICSNCINLIQNELNDEKDL